MLSSIFAVPEGKCQSLRVNEFTTSSGVKAFATDLTDRDRIRNDLALFPPAGGRQV